MVVPAVVIVESPAKAKTINRYLGKDFRVFASFGHVRDLPSRDGSVLPDEDFAMKWESNDRSRKHLREIIDAVKTSDRVILATDPDREGEAISWHLLEVLSKKKALASSDVQRVSFNAITRDAIKAAMKQPRAIDANLVDAYLARRALDYLVGFSLSPVLWRKLPGSRSAGRVQSVALRLVCDREAEIEAFRSVQYWSVAATVSRSSDAIPSFEARLIRSGEKTIRKLDIDSAELAESYREQLERSRFTVGDVEIKPTRQYPAPPFTTSTLQQEASRRLRFSAKQTMQIAQKLYEGIAVDGETTGLITYMRTDGVEINAESISSIRDQIVRQFDQKHVSPKPRVHKTKAKNAQEAHEAIRPTDMDRTPHSLKSSLDKDSIRLYEMIWKRTIASQMADAIIERTRVDITARDPQASDPGISAELGLRANGSVVTFPGFRAVYLESRDESEGNESGASQATPILPKVRSGDDLLCQALNVGAHSTEPPARFSEASLIKAMEELGIGRPSTYTSTLSVLRDREYVRTEKRRLVPEDKGRLVTAFLASFFSTYVAYDFTANMETQLDQISNGDVSWKSVLRDFWSGFSEKVEEVKTYRVTQVLDALNEVLAAHVFPRQSEDVDPRDCTKCEQGRLSLKVGKFGAFVGCSNYPDCSFTRTFSDKEEAGGNAASNGSEVLGQDPDTGTDILVKRGRFGPYFERMQDGKPHRASIPRTIDLSNIQLEIALKYLSLPRTIGSHPETGKPITSAIGRYGPYLAHDGTYTNLESIEDVFETGLNRAVSLIADRKSNSPQSSGRALGEHPGGGKVTVKSGRYGPYVQHGRVNATLPKGTDPEELSLEVAIGLLEAKQSKAPKTKRTSNRKKRAQPT